MIVAADLMRTDVTPLHAGRPARPGAGIFVENDLVALPVVDARGPRE